MAGCGSGCDNNNGGISYDKLPLLAGCPGDDETILVGNAEGGEGNGKFARRKYADIKKCIAASSVTWAKLRFTVGNPGSPVTSGENTLTITVNNPIEDSEIVVMDNNFLEPDMDDQISYTISYDSTQIIFTFNQDFANGQKYYIKYQKIN